MYVLNILTKILSNRSKKGINFLKFVLSCSGFLYHALSQLDILTSIVFANLKFISQELFIHTIFNIAYQLIISIISMFQSKYEQELFIVVYIFATRKRIITINKTQKFKFGIPMDNQCFKNMRRIKFTTHLNSKLSNNR